MQELEVAHTASIDEDDAVGEDACTCLAVAAACMYAFAPHVRLDLLGAAMGEISSVPPSFWISDASLE
jgi:hypothetical protein